MSHDSIFLSPSRSALSDPACLQQQSRFPAVPYLLQPLFDVREVRSIDYFNCRSHASLSRPFPDLYELLYVDKGELLLTFRETPYSLACGDLWICRPGHACSLCCAPKAASSLLRISFSCPSPSIVFLSERILHSETEDRILLAHLLSEARHLTAVSSGFEPSARNGFEPSARNRSGTAPPPGCLQMIQLYLEQLLIGLFRRCSPACDSSCLHAPLSFSGKKALSDKLYTGVLQYLHDNLNVPLSINQICRDISVSRSQLEKLFHEKHDCGVMDFFTLMKINEAKRLIEACNMTVSQIADTLGYSSVQYFSRQFKKQTKMTPSEYSRLAGKYSRTPSSP